MFEPTIRDFTKHYYSKEIELPEKFPIPSSPNRKIMHLSKVHNVFTAEQGEVALECIRTSKSFFPSFEFKGGKRDFYISEDTSHFEVSFKMGKVQEHLITSPIFTKKSSNIKRIMILAIERLARELNWQDTTHNLACNAIDYHFAKDAEEPLEWHSDRYSSTESHYSLVILLSNPNDEESGWTGGDLLYTAARVFELSKLHYEDRKKIYDLSNATKGEVRKDPISPIWQISPSHNDGILFGNSGMLHKVTSMSPLANEGRRMILTVFDFGPV